MFNLEPLRGSDWEEIIKQKNNPMNRTVEFIIEHNPDSITILEVMDIYRVAAGDPKNDQYLKHRNNLAAEVNPKLLAAGYELNSRAYIYPDLTAKDKRMEGQVWHKPGVSIRKITPRYNKYVMETFINGKTTRELLAPTDPSTEWDSII